MGPEPTLNEARLVGRELLRILTSDRSPLIPALQAGPMTSPELEGYTSREASGIDVTLHALEVAGVVACDASNPCPVFSLITIDTINQ